VIVISSFLSQINLILQIFILILLSLGMREIRIKRSFLSHGRILTIAAILNLVSFLVVMGPSFLGFQSFVFEQISETFSIITLAHSVFGSIAIIFSLGLVLNWRLQSSAKNCVGKKNVMQLVMALWIIALLSGIIYYFVLYPI
jgi:uncharacterized membrane protein YozB (DUF420 family)